MLFFVCFSVCFPYQLCRISILLMITWAHRPHGVRTRAKKEEEVIDRELLLSMGHSSHERHDDYLHEYMGVNFILCSVFLLGWVRFCLGCAFEQVDVGGTAPRTTNSDAANALLINSRSPMRSSCTSFGILIATDSMRSHLLCCQS